MQNQNRTCKIATNFPYKYKHVSYPKIQNKVFKYMINKNIPLFQSSKNKEEPA